MPPVGFEPKITAGERPQTYALDRAATGTRSSKSTNYGNKHEIGGRISFSEIRLCLVPCRPKSGRSLLTHILFGTTSFSVRIYYLNCWL